ncbi:hypothetical protein SAMN02799630_00268 [Paenibacillus sp. UNCCL117]|uniref:hypothetical protein n=1 Tax=unclassified Paenibacillus TaxID=185978 RepID=UPI00088E0E9F|nr:MULTISPECIES: hypothetical protein [unclassified Paenibacillus]SDC46076.1 hypothetical protein SAMN04488602_102264 [Paenibacillus sp. cl123]SFW12372.1 hypothetical protein SAMN02799630_00268 [Paenibacillus sp. UNCCL117]
MRFSKLPILVSIVLAVLLTSPSFAHPGKLDKYGGHECSYEALMKRLCKGYHSHTGGFFIGEFPSNEPTAPAPVIEEVIPEGHVKVTLPTFRILINYESGASDAQNSTLKYPFFMYNDIIYAPLNYDMCSTLTIESNWSNEVGLSLRKTDAKIGQGVRFQRIEASSAQPANMYAHLPSFNIYVNDTWVDNGKEEYPFLVYNDVTYYPMTWNNNNKFGLITGLKDNRFDISK